MPKKDPARLVKVSLKFLGIEAEWNADPTERGAAWSLYVELVTRIATQPLAGDEGLDREALTSLHSLFDSTRKILRKAGPDVGAKRKSVGGIAIAVLNEVLRPFLSRWHPALAAHESQRPAAQSPVDSERQWKHHAEFRAALAELREKLDDYATALAKIAGVSR